MSTSPSGGRLTGRASVPGAVAAPGRRSYGGAAPVGSARSSAPVYGGGSGSGGSGRGNAYKSKRNRPRWGRILLVTGAALLVLTLLGAGVALLKYKQIDASLNRDDPFSQITNGRPAKTVDGAINMLLLGSDSRDPDNGGKAGEWRTDTIIVLHIPADHQKAYLISIPRDLYVYIPKSKTTPYGDTKAKINASFSWGGTPLTVQTVEGFTGVRMDHVLLIDFGGFKNVVDALGGIDMNVEQDITSIHKPFRKFKKGMNHFTGEEALDYARQRYQFSDGDFARMRHQQQMMKAIMDKAASSGTLTNPKKLNDFLNAVTKAITVDKDFSLADMALQFRSIRSQDLTFMVSPHLGSQTVNGESVVVSDKAKATALYDAIKEDKVADWVTSNASPAPSASTSAKPNATRK